MRKPLLFVALAALPALAACEDSPVGPGGTLVVSGTYAAAPATAGELGALTFQAATGGATRDMIAEGASIVIGLHANGETSGRLFVPAGDEGGEDLDADLDGTWRLEAGRILLDHDADTFLRDVAFEVAGGELVADEVVGGVRVRVELERVTAPGGGDPVEGPAGFEVTADLAILESFPVQLVGSMTFTNVTSVRRELHTDECWPLLRAYRPGEVAPVWDQIEQGVCSLFTPRVDDVGPGGSVLFGSPVASAADVLDDELPDGRYRMTIYFRAMGGEEIEIELGEVDLAVPR